MTITEQVAAIIESETALKAQCEALERQVERQKGAIIENRAQLAKQEVTIQRQASLIATYENHFRSFHASAKNLDEQAKNATEAAPADKPNGKSNVTLNARPLVL
jgi:chromosome segregation ATPase